MFKIPKDKEVPFAGCTPGPQTEQEMMITGNWRINRPVINRELCNLCMYCIVYCPDASWQLSKDGSEVEWNWKYCKGCGICVNQCGGGALSMQPELDFEDGVVRLDKPF